MKIWDKFSSTLPKDSVTVTLYLPIFPSFVNRQLHIQLHTQNPKEKYIPAAFILWFEAVEDGYKEGVRLGGTKGGD